MVNRALFLDRDGVIDELVYYPSHDEWESPRTRADLRLIPGAAEALREAAGMGWLLFVISNQPSAVKGKTTIEELHAIDRDLRAQLAGIPILEFFYCYHHPDFSGPCECRKPSPYFVLQAARQYDVDLSRSWFAGDQDSDIECGQRAGVRTALLEYPHSAPKRGAWRADLVCADLAAFVRALDGQEASNAQ